jgi:signal-transduction protein with cAMP-binding, CBS, and nucleotidyltransferase domain
MMPYIAHTIKQMISISDEELTRFLADTTTRIFKAEEILNTFGKISNDIYFINKGILRVVITDNSGNEHTIHFALENQFVTDYSSFILKTPSISTLQALEETEVIVIPRKSIEWGYANLREGQKLGRLIAEFYFIYQDNRIINQYARTPKQRYDTIAEVFPNIHNRVPQYMIASYLGISPIHLSRLKKAAIKARKG